MATELSDNDDLIDFLKIQLSSLATLISEDGYTLACDQALQELGWSLPITDSFKIFWSIKRGARCCLEILKIASANKFKYKEINLHQRFNQFQKLIEDMDREYEKAIDSNIAAFAGVETFRMFGTKIDAGFVYNRLGEDITLNIDQYINFTPSDGDSDV